MLKSASIILLFVQLLEDLMVLLEDYSVWQTGSEWKEMEQMSLRCLLAFAAQDNSDVSNLPIGDHGIIDYKATERLLC